MAERRIRADGILPDYVNITWIKYDDRCDSPTATISAFDAYHKDCAHLIVGPSCEYSICESLRYFYADTRKVQNPLNVRCSFSEDSESFDNIAKP